MKHVKTFEKFSFNKILNFFIPKERSEYSKAYKRLVDVGIEDVYNEPSNIVYIGFFYEYKNKYPNFNILEDLNLLLTHLRKQYYMYNKIDISKSDIIGRAIYILTELENLVKEKFS
jgi:hypothetical protein